MVRMYDHFCFYCSKFFKFIIIIHCFCFICNQSFALFYGKITNDQNNNNSPPFKGGNSDRVYVGASFAYGFGTFQDIRGAGFSEDTSLALYETYNKTSSLSGASYSLSNDISGFNGGSLVLGKVFNATFFKHEAEFFFWNTNNVVNFVTENSTYSCPYGSSCYGNEYEGMRYGIDSKTLFYNAYFKYPLKPSLDIFLGFGAGPSFNKIGIYGFNEVNDDSSVDVSEASNSEGTEIEVTDSFSSLTFAFQGLIGVSYDISSSVAIQCYGRYVYYPTAISTNNQDLRANSESQVMMDIASINFGVLFGF